MTRDELEIVRAWFDEHDKELARLRFKRRAAFERIRREVPAIRHLSDASLGNAARYLRTIGVLTHWNGQRGSKQMLLFV